MLPHLLLVNGNSRQDLTVRMLNLAQARLDGLAMVEAMTISQAPAFISNAEEAKAAAPEILSGICGRVMDRAQRRPDAVMLACFGEPGLWTLRDSLPVPVTGMAEASGAAALQLGRRFSVLVSGRGWPAPIADLMALYGMDGRCVRITAVPDAALSDDPVIWLPALDDALAQEVALGGTDCVILGGGPLAGRGQFLTPPQGLRLVDAFDTTLLQTFALALGTRGRRVIDA